MIRLEQTCGACPEQYDVYWGDQEVGYIRHRHGITEAHCPFGEVVFTSEEARGDGMFEDDEREWMLNQCKQAILTRLLVRELEKV